MHPVFRRLVRAITPDTAPDPEPRAAAAAPVAAVTPPRKAPPRENLRDLEALRLKQIVTSIARLQPQPEDKSPLRMRHKSGLGYAGAHLVTARLASGLVQGRTTQQDPWWRSDEVTRIPTADELTEDKRVGDSETYLLREESRKIRLLDGRVFTTLRQVFYDKATRRHFKELSAITPEGQRIAYNAVPKHLMPLEGLDAVNITGQSELILVEGYPAAEALRARGIAAVGIISGTFDVPSERALDPVMRAGRLILWPDNDGAGASLMDKVARRLIAMGYPPDQMSLIFWRGGPRKGDAYDFDGSDKDLLALIKGATPWRPNMRLADGQILRVTAPKAPGQLRLDPDAQPPQPALTRSALAADSREEEQ